MTAPGKEDRDATKGVKSAITRLTRGRFFYGWIIVGVVAAANFMAVAGANPMVAVFMKPMAAEFGWSRTQVSLAVTIGSLGGGLLSLMGPLVDRHGARIVLVVGQAVYGSFLVLTSGITNLWQFYLCFSGGRILVTGPTRLAATVAISNWFIRKRGLAMGISILGIRAGQAILPLLAQTLVLVVGWRATWAILGLMVWVIALPPSLILMRRRPEDMDLMPDGRRGLASHPPELAASPAAPSQEPAWSLGQAIHTNALWLLTLASAQASLVGAGINLHLVPYLTDQGLHPTLAVGAVSLFAVAGGVGGLFWGYLSSRLPLHYCMTLTFLGSAVTLLILMIAQNVVLAYAFAVTHGLVFGGWVTLSQTMIAEYFGRRSVGAINGFVAPFQLFSNSLGPLLGGWVYDVTGGYLPAFVFFTGAYLLAALWVLMAKPPQAPTEKK